MLIAVLAWFCSSAVAGERSFPYPSVSLDPRIELLAVVHVLAGEVPGLDGFALNDSDYAREVRRRFWRLRGHPAVEAYRRARLAGLDAVGAQRMMLDLGDPPELATKHELPSEVERLVSLLKAFARDCRFMEFFNSHRPLYRSLVGEVVSEMKDRDYASMLEEYSGLEVRARYSMMLCPLRGPRQEGNMNHIECSEDGKAGHSIFATLGPTEIRSGIPQFQFWNRRWDLWHELSHTLLDRRLRDFPAEVQATSALFAPVADHCYGFWAQCLREHVAQGVAWRMLAWAKRAGRTKEDVWHPTAEQEEKLPYLQVVIDRLADYEARRDLYPTLNDFYPELLEAFAELARAKEIHGKAVPRPPRPSEAYAVEPANSECRKGARASREPVPPLSPPSAAAGEKLSVSELKARGVWLFLRGEAAEALKDFMRVRDAAPGDAEAHLNCSVALQRLGRSAEAMESAGRAIALARPQGPGSLLLAEALSTRAALWEGLKQFKNARRDYEEALRAAPSWWSRRRQIQAGLRK